jgi:hypothetical protein
MLIAPGPNGDFNVLTQSGVRNSIRRPTEKSDRTNSNDCSGFARDKEHSVAFQRSAETRCSLEMLAILAKLKHAGVLSRAEELVSSRAVAVPWLLRCH